MNKVLENVTGSSIGKKQTIKLETKMFIVSIHYLKSMRKYYYDRKYNE
jgi:hypothetical protein